jgi:type I restriction enzyme M protein
MLRFAANLTMMYNEVPFLERFAAAAADGFDAVEYLFPYDFTPDDIKKVADTFHAWQLHAKGEGYEDVAGFCYSASLDDIRKHEHVLTPGRYVGAEEQEDDGEVFADKMTRLTAQLAEQFAESDKLEIEIKTKLAGLGYGF